MTTILALDASSTMIGWCVLHDGRAAQHGEIKLPAGDIATRCEAAQRALIDLLDRHPADAVAIESPVARFASAVIPQARVSGALLAMCALREIVWLEIEPAKAKQALTSRGNADKGMMQAFASRYHVYGEHASDALGIALAAVGRVVVEEAA